MHSPELWTGERLVRPPRLRPRHALRLRHRLGRLRPRGRAHITTSLGLGGHLTLGPFFGDLDLSWREIFGDRGDSGYLQPQARLAARALVGFPARGSGLIAGGAFEAYLPGLSREADGTITSVFHIAPGFLVGVKL